MLALCSSRHLPCPPSTVSRLPHPSNPAPGRGSRAGAIRCRGRSLLPLLPTTAPPLSPQVGENGEHATVVLRRLSDSELGEGASDVRLDRLRAEPECATDSVVRASLRHQRKDLALARREPVERIGTPPSRDKVVDDRSVDHALAC